MVTGKERGLEKSHYPLPQNSHIQTLA